MADQDPDSRIGITDDGQVVHAAALTAGPRIRQVSLPAATERLGVTCSSVGMESAGYGLSKVADHGRQPQEQGRPPSRFDGPQQLTQDWLLAYMITGSAALELDGGGHHIAQGSVVCLPPQRAYRIAIDRTHPYCIYYLTFGGQSMRERKVCTAIDELSPTAEIDLCRDVIGIYQQLLEIGASKTVDAQRELGASIVLLVAKLVNRLHEHRKTNLQSSPVDRAKAIMSAHLFDHIGIGEIAREVGIPTSSFRRTFRAALGVPPYHYFLQCKIEAAKGDLLLGNVPLRAIAEKFCFADQYHFSRVFVRIAGCRPSEWRRAHHQRL